MCDYTQEVVNTWDKASPHTAADGLITVKWRSKKAAKMTAAPNDLFMISEGSLKLSPEKVLAFDNKKAKMLFITEHGRPDTLSQLHF